MKLPPLVNGVLLRRYKRFLADVELADGRMITAHCPNTGAMTGCAEPGWPVWLSVSDNPKRKYPHTWEIVQTPAGYISVNTGRANHLVAEAISSGRVSGLGKVQELRAEVKIPEGDGRFDFLVRTGPAAGQKPAQPGQVHDVYIEVKSVTLLDADGIADGAAEGAAEGVGAFPDAVSSRALKHVEALRKRVAAGDRGMLIFCAQHCGINQVRAAAEVDPAYAAALRAAQADGVEVLAFGCTTDLQVMYIDRAITFC